MEDLILSNCKLLYRTENAIRSITLYIDVPLPLASTIYCHYYMFYYIAVYYNTIISPIVREIVSTS